MNCPNCGGSGEFAGRICDKCKGSGEIDIKLLLKSCGENVTIHPLAKIVKPEVIEIGDNTQIDDFSFIYGGQGIEIGKNVHICSFVSIIGGGKFIIGDYASLTAGCRVITGSDDFTGEYMVSPTVPTKFRKPNMADVVEMQDYSVMGTNSVIHPGTTIKEGSVTGSCTLITKDLEPWGIYTGTPARRVGERSKNIIDLGREYARGIKAEA